MLRKFKVVVEPEAEGGYSVYVPSLPGCASQGESVEEAIGNIKEAIAVYVLSLKEDNLPIPPANVNIELREVEVSV